ncbi:hypothetical protein PsorP6_013639 [Peronosclerospora sorghi]|uniref:Uncharacterized protein n=1 Tax=Peronosclerospora sorghi TaxID=230839 RepID=A0ACC0VHF4_9STRA|nr:hypothetical protein PsorP6_013639 [Peronosclerospora sorghi]
MADAAPHFPANEEDLVVVVVAAAAKNPRSGIPVTKLGRLIKEGKICSLEEIYLFSLPIKECEIVNYFLESSLKDEVMKIMPVQKQTRAGQRTRFKAFVAVGDSNGHIGLGVKCAKEVATAIRDASILAKISLLPVRRGYWGRMVGAPHTGPNKVTGKCGSVRFQLIPAPRGTGLCGTSVPKNLLEDYYTSACGHTRATLSRRLSTPFVQRIRT